MLIKLIKLRLDDVPPLPDESEQVSDLKRFRSIRSPFASSTPQEKQVNSAHQERIRDEAFNLKTDYLNAKAKKIEARTKAIALLQPLVQARNKGDDQVYRRIKAEMLDFLDEYDGWEKDEELYLKGLRVRQKALAKNHNSLNDTNENIQRELDLAL